MCNREESRFGEGLMRFVSRPLDYLSPGRMTNTTLSVGQAMIARTVKPADQPKDIVQGRDIYTASKDITG